MDLQITHQEIINHFLAIYERPDEALLTTAEAALFLNASERTIARWRQEGSGPAFIKFPQSTSSMKQKVLYQLSDLRQFIQNSKVKSNIEVAVKAGLAFINLESLIEEHPFFIDRSSNKIAAHAFLLNAPDFYDYLPSDKFELAWIPFLVAINEDWINGQGWVIKECYQNLLSKMYNEILDEI